MPHLGSTELTIILVTAITLFVSDALERSTASWEKESVNSVAISQKVNLMEKTEKRKEIRKNYGN